MLMTLQTEHFLLTVFPHAPHRSALLSFCDGGSALALESDALSELARELTLAAGCASAAREAAQEGGSDGL